MVRVENCFHWIGFHLVTYLMDQGIKIYGIDQINTAKKEFFNLLVGRNDKFTLGGANSRRDEKDITIKICPPSTEDNQDEHVIVIKKSQRANDFPQTCSLHIPHIIGKWMSREAVEAVINRTPSTNDLNKMIRLDELLTVIYQWIQRDGLLPQETYLLSQRNPHFSQQTNMENYVYLREYQSIEPYVDDIIQHYHQFSDFY